MEIYDCLVACTLSSSGMRVYKAGATAFHAGQDRIANPYEAGTAPYWIWFIGWLHQRSGFDA
jgi:hypothetical protein